MTRVYVPTTLIGLARAQKEGTLDQETAHAVTGAVREWYVEGDTEELEYTAMIDAAESSLRLLAGEPDAPRRRVVMALDVPEALIAPGGDQRSSVRLSGPVALSKVVSVHIDEVESEPIIGAAVGALAAAAEGDDDARFQLDEAEACDLLWYDVSEIDDLVN
jgi:hypothetical protein